MWRASSPFRHLPQTRTFSYGLPLKKLDHSTTKRSPLNLDPSTFGFFSPKSAAGQEVARWFLLVGGGVRHCRQKRFSAYDKEVSDDLYGSGSRYVSKQRLEGDAGQTNGRSFSPN